ncbi:hypothetical protein [Ligilactobacillus animalis]|uniref:hypothetical protein n=1 Tax=Ligilactobacillus animalis TaxID=1605 RepID=UPI002A74F3AD|nr:hypothetical protein [Ligilactobacillus animalis]
MQKAHHGDFPVICTALIAFSHTLIFLLANDVTLSFIVKLERGQIMYSSGQLAKQCQVTLRTVQYYERQDY